MFGGAAQPGGDQQGADLVAVQADGVGLIVQAGPADMDRRGMIEEILLYGVAVEAGHGAQPPRHRRPSPATVFKVAAEGFDVGASGLEEMQAVVGAPSGELAQIQHVGVAGHPAVAGQESGQRQALPVAELRLGGDQHRRCDRGGHRFVPPGSGRDPEPQRPRPGNNETPNVRPRHAAHAQ